ncbi:UNVERIFIED_CONTAM: hypothetical protein Scaly_3063100 [Sesamum calycinum]|uniref:Reverse transcriptase domain-containing protein n=1 Tax=Sesamum calycinum TaxID=2727403 RepID=A0AAW2K0C6_9LAMI
MRRIGSDSSYKGKPGIIYSPEETAELAARLKFALVGNVSVGRLNFKHVLIRLSNEEDFSRIWLRGEWTFDSFHMRVFKWTPDFDPQIESPIAPVWIRLPALPVHLFEKNALFTLATKIGKPLRMDEPTANLSRPDLARVYVEIDVTSPKVQAVHFQIEGKTYRQQVIYENYPPYCTSCNHLGHEITNCILIHNNEKRQVDMDSKLIGDHPSNKEDTRDLRELINHKRKGKNMVTNLTDIASPSTNVGQNAENSLNVADNKHVDVTEINVHDILVANDVFSHPSHVPEPRLPNLQQNSGVVHVAEASLEDSNYEDPLIAALLDRNWETDKTAPNSTPEETPQHNASLFRKWTRGESNKKRHKEDKSWEQSPPTIQTAALESDGEEKTTPISNWFQSLEDMEMEDILQHIEKMQTSKSTAVEKGVERGEDDGQFHKRQSIAISGPQEGEAIQQAIIFKNSAITNKHKRNKSLEGTTENSMKIDKKGASQEDIFCTFVYAMCYRNSRRLLWDELTSISNLHAPWRGHEKNGPSDDFNDMMIDTGLMDAGFEGDPYTWTNKRVWKRLDRVLYSKEWTDTYNSTRVQHLPRRLSDHHPLFITAAKTENRKPSSFRFQNMWLNHHSFFDTVRQEWNLPIEGYGMYKLQQKIHRTKELLKRWNREVFGNVFTTVEHAKQEAEEAEKNFDRDPSEANLIALNKCNAALVHALSLESEYWRQKSNCKWLEDGERNTKYFHSLVKKKRLKSTIHRIFEENQKISDPDQIKDSAARYFENLLSGISHRNDTPDFPFQFSKLSLDALHSISNIPTQEEIMDIVFSIDKDSVAGPDGFSSVFFQKCWDFIKNDIQEAVRDFFCGTPMSRSFKATTIVLIPKVESPQTWSDFRPISLCNVTNKILSKLLYKKLSLSLLNLISPSQSGFITGRLISDNILMAQEMIHHLDLRYKNSNLVIKLDMSKAYDRVDWNFLLLIMEKKMGFPSRFLSPQNTQSKIVGSQSWLMGKRQAFSNLRGG